VRYSGSSLGYQLASITAGGPAPIIATLLLRKYGLPRSIASYRALLRAQYDLLFPMTEHRGQRDRE
jgi:hypothetical protein